MARAQQNRTWSEVTGLIVLGLGTLLFLALVSYTPRDLPPWFNMSSTTDANVPVQNFVGVAGAVVAACCYFLVGAASYLAAAAMLGYGWAKLIAANVGLGRRWPWLILFILSGACLLQIQPWFLKDWGSRMNIGTTAGGWLGYYIGERSFVQLFQKVGSFILLGSIYVASLIMITGLHPVRTVRRILQIPSMILEKYHAYRVARANKAERLALEQQKLEREARKLERQLKKKKTDTKQLRDEPRAEQDLVLSNDEEEAEPVRPAPQIIDTAVVTPRARPEKKEKLVPMEATHFDNYRLPEMDLLEPLDIENREAADPEELRRIQNTLIETLDQFGISAQPGDITKGPTITRYELYPAKGVRVDRIVSLERDLARATRAERINILAPIPGKDTVGVEIANSRKVKVTLRELLESEDWASTKAKIPLALGKDVYGKTIIADLAVMPHCLVAGTTGSGKSVCINSIIASMLYRFTPDDLRLIMIDPKVVEMQVYNNLPHLVIPVVTDPKKVLLALRWVIDEMEKRYKIFAKVGVRNVTGFNARPKPRSQKELDAEAAAQAESLPPEVPAVEGEEEPEFDPEELTSEERIASMGKITVPRDDDLIIPEKMPYIVVIVDELADLMQTAPADVESAIARITQMARAAGIHMLVATQTPRADVVTGIIKANIPSRIAFQVASKIDSRVILDENGAERLLGQGDMLYLPPGTSRMVRAQGVLVTDEEIHRLVEFAAEQGKPVFDGEMHEKMQSSSLPEEELSDEDEELVEKCIEVMRQEKKASTSLFQRRLRLGYTRAARVMDILEQRGYVAAGEGAKPREILVDLDAIA